MNNTNIALLTKQIILTQAGTVSVGTRSRAHITVWMLTALFVTHSLILCRSGDLRAVCNDLTQNAVEIGSVPASTLQKTGPRLFLNHAPLLLVSIFFFFA